MLIHRWLAVAVLMGLLSLELAVAAMDQEQLHERYVQGNQHYRRGEYEAAIEAYQFVLSQTPNGHVYYNLGNAYLRQDKRGWAIWCYERSLNFLPRDRDVHANLDHANSANEDRFEYRAYPLSLAQIYDHFTSQELAAGYSIVFAACIATFATSLLWSRGNRWLRFLGASLAVLGCICLLCMFLKWRSNQFDYAILTEEQSEARGGPGTQFDSLFMLHEGAKVEALNRTQDWVEIGTPDNRRGWVRRDSVAEL